MRCANCHRKLNPANAFTAHDRRTYGPVCAQRLGFVALRLHLKSHLSKHIVRPRTAVRVDDGQADLFGVAA